ncbi:MAG: FGGY-family carbohydrate kinase [Syntrophothermus sp.]
MGWITREAARETGLTEGTPVIAGTIDATAEAISVGTVNPGEAMLMYGTTMFIISVLDSFRVHPALWALAYTMPGRAVVAAGQATSAALTKWFRDNFGHVERETERLLGIDAYQLLMAEAESVPAGSGGLIALPYFSGERTPIYDPLARGMVIGLALSHTRAHVYRALLEGTAFGLRHTFETMAEIGGLPGKVFAVGGGTKNSLWLQIVSDVTGIPQEVPRTTIGASYGDAFLAGIGVGLFRDFNEIRTRWIEPGRTVTPNSAEHKLYSEYYQIFRALYENNKGSMHRLAELGSR